jgi:hypothetical protein
MRTEELRNLFSVYPFQSIRLTMADGAVHIIDDTEFALVSKDGRTLTIYDQLNPDKAFKLLDIMLITSLEVGPRF